MLVKAVLQAIPTYLMSCFLLPGNLVNSFELAIREFWWGQGAKRKMAWIAWAQLCRPKQQGGLGFRDLRSFNMALLAKQGWRILTNPESLMARIFEARYFPQGNFLEATVGYRPSATWSSIIKARALLINGLRIRIGNGHSRSIWDSPWIPDEGHFKVLPHDLRRCSTLCRCRTLSIRRRIPGIRSSWRRRCGPLIVKEFSPYPLELSLRMIEWCGTTRRMVYSL